jgi:hypothetical protein
MQFKTSEHGGSDAAEHDQQLKPRIKLKPLKLFYPFLFKCQQQWWQDPSLTLGCKFYNYSAIGQKVHKCLYEGKM